MSTLHYVDTSTFRKNLKTSLSLVKTTKQPLIIRERGVPSYAVVDIDELEDYLTLQNPRIVEKLLESRAQALRGELHTLQEVFANIH
jgi:PHD/YefM family antitoxin component YafN of YafNO toxin-antitoxin module